MTRRAATMYAAAPCAALCAAFLSLTGCGDGARAARQDWVIRSRLVFLTADLSAARPPPPLESYRVWFPFVIGDFYGPPGTGDFVGTSIRPDRTFEVDLNRSLRDLIVSLEPTHFGLSYMRITPADARIARLAPAALQANGIDPIGRTDWVDMDSRQRLMLVYVDRPARITGRTVARGTPIVCNLSFPAAGYAWIRVRSAQDRGISYSIVPRPKHLALAVTPTSN